MIALHDWTKVAAGDYHHFHTWWCAYIGDALNEGILPSDYYALIEQDGGAANPDVLALKLRTPSEPVPPSGVMTLQPKASYHSRSARKSVRPRQRVAIRHHSGNRIVAMVELVSPGNKNQRVRFQRFVDKCVDILQGDVNLMVIDPFPPTKYDPDGIHASIWHQLTGSTFVPPEDKDRTLVSYIAGEIAECFVEPLAVGDAMPAMPLYIAPDRHVMVPLSAAYERAWKRFPTVLHGALEV